MKKQIALFFLVCASTALLAAGRRIPPGYYVYAQTIMGNASNYMVIGAGGKCQMFSTGTEEIFKAIETQTKIPYKKMACKYNVAKEQITFYNSYKKQTIVCELAPNSQDAENAWLECEDYRDGYNLKKDFDPNKIPPKATDE